MRGLSVVILTGLLVGLAGWGVTNGEVDAPPECSVTLSEDQSIQAAIDDAQRGDVICLESGIWQESISIDKSVSLRGLGDERATIRGTEQSASDGFSSVVLVRGEDLDIELRSLELLSAERGALNGLQVAGSSFTQSASLSIRNVRVANAAAGMRIRGPDVTATVRHAVVEDNTSLGIDSNRTEAFTIEDSTVANNGFYGIEADGAESLTVVDGRVVDNKGLGILLENGVQATVRGTTIRDTTAITAPGQVDFSSSVGIHVSTGSQLRLIESAVRNNGSAEAAGSSANGGIVVGGTGEVLLDEASARAKIVNSRIEANWVGILIGPTSGLHMEQAAVRESRSWGIAGTVRPCFDDVPPIEALSRITGEIIFAGGNAIEGNNTAGRLDGDGNPGNHPFTNSPDGQVCLPR